MVLIDLKNFLYFLSYFKILFSDKFFKFVKLSLIKKEIFKLILKHNIIKIKIINYS